MSNMIKLLIWKLNTIDGQRDSAKPFGLFFQNNREIRRKVYLKYLVLKIRQKISYQAF